MFKGLTVHKTKCGICIYEVPKTDVDFEIESNRKEIVTNIEKGNTSRGIQFFKLPPFRLKLHMDEKLTTNHFIVVFIEHPQVVDNCLKLGFYINHQRYVV